MKRNISKLTVVAVVLLLGNLTYSYAQQPNFTPLHSFPGPDTDPYGNGPSGGLALSGNTLYGSTLALGAADNGTVFQVNTDGTGFSTLYSFTAEEGTNADGNPVNSDGIRPGGGLVCSGNTLYGVANSAGSLGDGTIFAINTDGTGFRILHSFATVDGANINSDGAHPFAGLILSGNTLYGTAFLGGSSGNGTVFAINTDGTGFTTLYSFSSPDPYTLENSDGANPEARLTLSGNILYGTTPAGGSSGYGTIFALNTDGTGFATLFNFSGGGAANPPTSLIVSGNTLFGGASSDGISGGNSLFSLNTDGTDFIPIHTFATPDSVTGENADGDDPAGLVLVGNTLYGTAYGGGPSGNGTVFEVNIDGTGFTTLHSFSGIDDFANNDGAGPSGGMILSGTALYGTTTYGGSGRAGTVFAVNIPGPTITLSPLRVTLQQANVKSTDDIDAPIVPVTDTSTLATASIPLGLGVVADGVTPVLFNITGPPGNYTIVLNNTSANSNPSFYTNIYVLQNGAWTNSTNFVISPQMQSEIGTNYAYLQGLDWSQFFGPPPYQPVMITMSVISAESSSANSVTFEVRPPPIVLIHGYAANASSWTPSFLNNLYNFEPTNFVFPINYGTDNQNSVNTMAPLGYLAITLDEDLAAQVEEPLTNWAYTRYDVVGHSQGGVLARMLCQTFANGTAAFIGTPVVSQQNFYRGRFRRVITIGSPHNGSVLVFYLLWMENSDKAFSLASHIPYFMGESLQAKFNPFGPQIAQINNPSLPVDPRIKFICIQTAINSGQPPSATTSIDCYGAIGLETSYGGILLPNGSDGVVDFDSQGGGGGTPDKYIWPPDIAHADVTSLDGLFELFGVPPGQSDTTYPLVAQNVIALLNGAANAFGSFQLPQILSPARELEIENIVPALSHGDMIFAAASKLDLSTNYDYFLQLPGGVPGGGAITWFAQVFGTNGVSSDGIKLLVNATNSGLVALTVTNGIQGSVVLYATYAPASGGLIFANPVVVVSNTVGATLSSIQLQPPSATLSPGDILLFNIWGIYTNGAANLLYLADGQASYFSSNPDIASVNSFGTVTVNSFGTATITACYNGLTAQSVVSSITSSFDSVSGTIATNGAFQLTFIGAGSGAYVIQASRDLINWVSIATNYDANGFIQYQDFAGSNFSRRFYRVQFQ
jgi:uncharacterized repeat protein (TIGR03803 family)